MRQRRCGGDLSPACCDVSSRSQRQRYRPIPRAFWEKTHVRIELIRPLRSITATPIDGQASAVFGPCGVWSSHLSIERGCYSQRSQVELYITGLFGYGHGLRNLFPGLGQMFHHSRAYGILYENLRCQPRTRLWIDVWFQLFGCSFTSAALNGTVKRIEKLCTGTIASCLVSCRSKQSFRFFCLS